MKLCVFIYFFLILLAPYALATNGTTSLTTFYPAPTAAYGTVSLASNYITNATQSTATTFCTSLSTIGKTYLDTNNNNMLYVCTNIGASSPANGTIHSDSSGTLHVVMNNQDVVYPQECYNRFCSFSIASGTCASSGQSCSYMATPATSQGNCLSGFNQMPVNHTGGVWYDLLQTSATTCSASIVCCTSIYNSTLPALDTGYPPDETTTTTLP